MKVFYSDTFDLPLPEGHRFPGQKYGMLRRRLLVERILTPHHLSESPLVDPDDIARAHASTYIAAIESGDIDPMIMRRIGLPWSAHLVTRTKATMGGAVEAVAHALEDGISGQLAGGTHHAHHDFGAGYCVFNDFAVAALAALSKGWAKRIAVVDLDVHQGDGNAAMLSPRNDIFVLSIHGQKNFPFRKVDSDLDVALPDGTDDAGYMDALRPALAQVFAFRPDLILYQTGVDPLEQDRLGRLSLTFDGLMARDRHVLSEAKRHGIPVSMGIGGGYAVPIEDTVTAYANTYRVVREVFGV